MHNPVQNKSTINPTKVAISQLLQILQRWLYLKSYKGGYIYISTAWEFILVKQLAYTISAMWFQE